MRARPMKKYRRTGEEKSERVGVSGKMEGSEACCLSCLSFSPETSAEQRGISQHKTMQVIV